MPKVLLVEDDAEICSLLAEWFKEEQYTLETVHTGADALQLLSGFQYDAIILDWGLPDQTGIEVCRRFRANGGDTPILFLTGKGEVRDKLVGLDSGADDYLVKPFDVRELGARMRSLLRRPAQVLPVNLNVQGVFLDTRSKTVKTDSTEIRLMPKECALLEFLMRHPNNIYSSRALMDSVWSSENEVSEDSVRTCMKTLRLKLKKVGRDDLIKTVLGSGYMIETG